MDKPAISKATLGRLPAYYQYVTSDEVGETISAASIARALGYGEVQVRKDLNAVSGEGRPKIGYITTELIAKIRQVLGYDETIYAVVVGAGKIGRALLNHKKFDDYGLDIIAAFDTDPYVTGTLSSGKNVYHINQLEPFCREKGIRIGILTVPAEHAQEACNSMIHSGITAIWNFAEVKLDVPSNVVVKNENLALSLAYLNVMSKK